ncbi:MAG: hypothetical protein KME45_27465 [Stenomitos rutilans HA7619-LM2]|jgi:hypothetical protein|nr:hypothetical protein [Stenomitos rutilans HA7619-LM2]
MTKIDLNALKQLSNIELFLLLCGAIAPPKRHELCERLISEALTYNDKY